jgi:hypothetical protein
VFLAAGLGAAVLNAIFQRIGARRIAIDDLGAFNALVAIIGGIGLLGLGLQVVIARLRPATDGGEATLALGRLAVLAGAATGALVAVAVPGPAWYRLEVGALMAVSATATFCGVAPRARLLRRSSWSRLALVYIVGALIRLAAVVPLIEAIDTQLLAVLAATALSEISMTILARRLGPRSETTTVRIGRADARLLVLGFVALGGLWMLTVADTVLARTRLSDADADAYAFASTVARSTFFLAQLLAHLALPTFIREDGRTERLRRVFSITVLATGGAAAAGAAVVLVAPGAVARSILGENASLVDPSTLRLLACAWAAMSVLPLLTYFHSARHPRLAFVPAVTAVAVLGPGLLIDTPAALAVSTLALVGACAVMMAVPALQRLSPVNRSVVWPGAVPSHRVELDRGVAVVVPFYNPGPQVVVRTVSRLVATLEAHGSPFRVVAVSDGSTDGSVEALTAAALPHVDVVSLERNRGKGAALRAGFARAHAPLIGYIDADGDLPPEQLAAFLDIAAETGADAVVGSKVHPDSDIANERVRRLLSALFRVTVRVLFRLDVHDTQTGLKVYRGDVMGSVVPMLREDGFAIDVEILVAANRLGSSAGRLSIVEAPVQIVARAQTTVSSRRALSTLTGLGRIFWRDHVALGYHGARPATAAAAAAT